MGNYLFPNEAVINWDLLIVIYPYITGLVAGAFILSSLYHVFGIQKLKSVSRFSLVTALAFLLVAPLPLVVHLGHPERALEMFLRPNFTSAMSGFGFIWMGYLLLVLAEVWLVFRPDIIHYVKISTGIKKSFYSILTLGVQDVSEKTLELDHKVSKILAFIGIPAACLLHGYVGFIFGAIKANPWWSTPLMPLIFLVSAIVSGIALQIVLYIVVTKLRKAQLDRECVNNMALWLGGFLSAAILVEGLEILSRMYESEESWAIISQLITQRLDVTYIGVQFLFGMILPIIILGMIAVFKFKPSTKLGLQTFAGIAILIGVFAMRWNVVIGGQLVSKSLRGLNSYTPPLLGGSGILVTGLILALPFILFAVISYLIPPWNEATETSQEAQLEYAGSGYKKG
jgi:Ni/Fe-hydrogenase subunit HybB-like protein